MEVRTDKVQAKRSPVVARSNLLVTAVVGLLMLVAGMLAGYFGRPLVAPLPVNTTPVAVVADTGTPSVASDDGATTSNPSSATLAALMDAVVAQTRHFKGDPGAPVIIIEFSDFQCPYCGRFVAGAGRQIDETYIEAGLVRFGYQHFAFLGPESQWTAEASECAAEQGAFWAYHDLVFERQAGENRGAFNKDNLKQLAAELGLDAEAFNACLDSGKYAALVRTETATGRSLGVTGTPAFLVNGRPVVGTQPFVVFQQVIEAELGATNQ